MSPLPFFPHPENVPLPKTLSSMYVHTTYIKKQKCIKSSEITSKLPRILLTPASYYLTFFYVKKESNQYFFLQTLSFLVSPSGIFFLL